MLSSSSAAPCAGESVRQFTLGATGIPRLYFEIRQQKWFTVEAVDVLLQV